MARTVLVVAALVLAAGVALPAVDGSRGRAQGVASIALPDPGGVRQLYEGCNNIGLTFPDGTSSQEVVQAVSPSSAVESMWRHDASMSAFQGFSPSAPQASDLLTVNFLDAVWLCIHMPQSAVTLSEQDAGSTVQLRVGQGMEIALEGNPTTGFSWETENLDTSVLRQLGEAEFQPATELIGSGGTFTFRFEAVGAGQTVLRLVYHRSWETGVPPEKTFEVTVTVQ